MNNTNEAVLREQVEQIVRSATANRENFAAVSKLRAALAATATVASAEQPAGEAAVYRLIERAAKDTTRLDQNQPGYHHAQGWNAALRQIGDYVRGGALASPTVPGKPT